ncbi:MAG: hypothetical protein HRU08_04490 [Oleispira sp.]|nr:hypothetical protein [Oleispira sp.]
MLEVDDKVFASADINGLSINGESMIQSLISHYLASWKISATNNKTHK